jgi:hypothetical protein
VIERPEWLTESPAALLLLFLGTLFALISVVYLVVPADALPSSIPGRWTPPPTSSTVSTTTTTTLPPAVKKAGLRKIAEAQQVQARAILALPPDKRQAALLWIKTAAVGAKEELVIQQILDTPAVPPSRQWAYAFIAAVLAAGTLAAAWFVSDTRGRIHFGK